MEKKSEEQFVSDATDYLCVICQQVCSPEDALEHVDCSRIFCSACIREWCKIKAKCPHCNGPTPSFDGSYRKIKNDNKFIYRKMLSLKLHCDHYNSGEENCTAVVEWGDLESHLAHKCELAPKKCKWGCGYACTAKHLEKHESNCVLKRLQCNYCDAELLNCSLEDHLATECTLCPDTVVSCPFARYGCTEKVKRTDIEAHVQSFMADHMCKLVSHQEQQEMKHREDMSLLFGRITELEAELKTSHRSNGLVYNLGNSNIPRPRKKLIYVLGGEDDSNSSLSRVECYDPEMNVWSTRIDMLSKRCFLSAAVLGDSIYASGGSDGGAQLSSVERYDAATDRWYLITCMNTKRWYHSLVSVGEYSLYAIGGHDGTACLNSAEHYDARSGKWNSIPPMGCKRSSVTAVAVPYNNSDDVGRIFAIGGYSGSSALNSVEYFDIRSGRWGMMSEMRSNRCYTTAVLAPNKLVYVMGGHDGNTQITGVESFDPYEPNLTSARWTSMAPLDNKRSGASAAVLGDNIYLTGGFDGTYRVKNAESYNVVTNRWTPVASMNFPLRYHAAVSFQGPR